MRASNVVIHDPSRAVDDDATSRQKDSIGHVRRANFARARVLFRLLRCVLPRGGPGDRIDAQRLHPIVQWSYPPGTRSGPNRNIAAAIIGVTGHRTLSSRSSHRLAVLSHGSL